MKQSNGWKNLAQQMCKWAVLATASGMALISASAQASNYWHRIEGEVTLDPGYNLTDLHLLYSGDHPIPVSVDQVFELGDFGPGVTRFLRNFNSGFPDFLDDFYLTVALIGLNDASTDGVMLSAPDSELTAPFTWPDFGFRTEFTEQRLAADLSSAGSRNNLLGFTAQICCGRPGLEATRFFGFELPIQLELDAMMFPGDGGPAVDGGDITLWISVIPEPSTAVFVFAGIIAFGIRRF